MQFTSNANASLIQQFRQWAEEEWGEVDSFEGTHGGVIVPPPILAIEDDCLQGGLAFSSFAMPGELQIGIWINVVFVAPAQRGRGIAAALLKQAEITATGQQIDQLFVYTDIPKLYLQQDWSVVDDSGESTVLKKILREDETEK